MGNATRDRALYRRFLRSQWKRYCHRGHRFKGVRDREPNEVIGNEAQERLIEGNHEGTKSQSFSWCLCVFVVQIPGLSQSNIILAPSMNMRNEKLRCLVSQWYDARSDLWCIGRLPVCDPIIHRLEAYATYFTSDPNWTKTLRGDSWLCVIDKKVGFCIRSSIDNHRRLELKHRTSPASRHLPDA